jgi:serine protease Do
VYPLPQNIGLTLSEDQGNRVKAIGVDSPAAQAGLREGDVLKTIHGMSVASFADVQYALHRAPANGRLNITWEREEREHAAELALREGWRQTDISWRASTLRLGPAPCVRGQDLTAGEKRALGLQEGQLAFRQGNFVSRTAQQAGIRQDDVILGIDNKILEMSARQFGVYIRLNYQVGDQITLNILRSGQRLQVPLRLPSPEPY